MARRHGSSIGIAIILKAILEFRYDPSTSNNPRCSDCIGNGRCEWGCGVRGFAAIGLHCPKTGHNIGGVLRAAHCYGASSVAISGQRINSKHINAATNTMKTHRHIPVLRGELRDMIPFGAVPIAVDLVDDATPLPDFDHPTAAFYIFGPEDGTLGKAILDFCPMRVMVPTSFCMNLAATVNVVLYDRLAKQVQP